MNYFRGKIRCLQICSTCTGVFTILALDHGGQYLGAGAASTDGIYGRVLVAKIQILAKLASLASAVLLDSGYGLPDAVNGGALPGQVGLLLSAEDGSYHDTWGQKSARVLDGWSVSKIKRAGAAAVKLFFSYHPDHQAAAAKLSSARSRPNAGNMICLCLPNLCCTASIPPIVQAW